MQEREADLSSLPAGGPLEAGQGTEAAEYVEISEADQAVLHETLNKIYTAVPVETGAYDDDLNANASVLVHNRLEHRST